jgi:hypothetical protein
MTALQNARGLLALLQAALEEADLERAREIVDALADAHDAVRVPYPVDHICVTCMSDCDTVVSLRRRARFAEQDAQRLAFELAEAKRLKRWAA